MSRRGQAPCEAPSAPAPSAPVEEPPRRGRRRRRRTGGPLVGLFKLALWMFILGFLAVTVGAAWLSRLAADLPETARLAEPPRRSSVVVLGRGGEEIARRGAVLAREASVEELPGYLVDAVLTVEDRRFYEHGGVDVRGLARAAVENMRAGRVVQGGSTLTQQLAKNLFLDSERTLARKGREMLIARWIEQRYSKDEILELYLNRVYFGAGAYGIEAAAQRYFGKPAAEVTLAEAAMLAGLLKAPSRLSPTRDVARAEARAAIVLDAMLATGAITDAEHDAALEAPLRVRAASSDDGAGYFADWAAALARARSGGAADELIVHTTLDTAAQAAAERAVAEAFAEGAEGADEQVALVALDGDGAVRAMVGGRAYAESQFNRAVQARRQPGSAFKPFVYAAAIEAGLSPWDVRSDAPITLGDWSPTNFDGAHVGDVTLIRALADSINTVAVRVAEEIGRDRVVRVVKRLGVTSHIRPTRSMALGSYEVTPIEVTAAYAAFANGGYAVRPYAVTRVETPDGVALWTRPEPEAARALDPYTVRQMNVMLARVVSDGTARAAALPDRSAAGKTGTTNDFRDAWFIGYVPGFVAGVWVGTDDFTPMERVTGGTLPARIWRAFMSEALAGAPVAALDADPYWLAIPTDMPGSSPAPADAGLDAATRSELDALLRRLEAF